jgi:hypothetical protein
VRECPLPPNRDNQRSRGAGGGGGGGSRR